jgi:hypothetical protein
MANIPTISCRRAAHGNIPKTVIRRKHQLAGEAARSINFYCDINFLLTIQFRTARRDAIRYRPQSRR